MEKRGDTKSADRQIHPFHKAQQGGLASLSLGPRSLLEEVKALCSKGYPYRKVGTRTPFSLGFWRRGVKGGRFDVEGDGETKKETETTPYGGPDPSDAMTLSIS